MHIVVDLVWDEDEVDGLGRHPEHARAQERRD